MTDNTLWLSFTFQMGAGSFGSVFGPPRDAARAELRVQSSGSIVALAGYDPSAADTSAGFTYSYDFGNHYPADHTWDVTGSSPLAVIPSSVLYNASLYNGGQLVVHGRTRN